MSLFFYWITLFVTMKKLLVLIVAALGSVRFAAAQDYLPFTHENKISISNADGRFIRAYAALHPASGDIYQTWAIGKAFYHCRVTKDYTVKDQFEVPFSDAYDYSLSNSEQLAYHFAGNTLTRMIYDYGEKKIVFNTIDMDRQQSDAPEITPIPKSEHLIDGAWHDNAFYFISIDKKEDLLRIYQKIPGQPLQSKAVNIGGLFKTNKVKLTNILPAAYYVPAEGTLDLARVHTDAKLYFHNKALQLTLDNYEELTQVITIPLDTYKPVYTSFPQDFSDCAAKRGRTGNSLFFDRYFFQINACINRIQLRIFTRDGSQLLHTYTAPANGDNPFANSEIRQYGSTYFEKSNTKRILGGTDQLIDKMQETTALVAALYERGKLLVKVGAYARFEKNGAAMFVPGGDLVAAMGDAEKSESKAPLANDYSRSSSFCTVLDTATAAHQPSIRYDYDKEAAYRLNRYARKELRKFLSKRSHSMVIPGGMLLSYIHPEDATLNFIVFANAPVE
jgi:hypothetical protein